VRADVGPELWLEFLATSTGTIDTSIRSNDEDRERELPDSPEMADVVAPGKAR